MKRIGLLGGMSWESSVEYERLINQGVRAALGGVSSADLVVRSYDFAEIEALQSAGDWDGAAELLVEGARMLEGAGAEVLLLCTNTMHLVAPAIEAAVSVRFLHLADVTADAVIERGLSSVGLLGTRFTMELDFYRERLERRGLEVLVPEESDRRVVDQVIYDELVRGVVAPASKARFLEIIDRLVAGGAEGVIAGCTEIELLVAPSDVAIPYFATTRLHAEAAVVAAIS